MQNIKYILFTNLYTIKFTYNQLSNKCIVQSKHMSSSDYLYRYCLIQIALCRFYIMSWVKVILIYILLRGTCYVLHYTIFNYTFVEWPLSTVYHYLYNYILILVFFIYIILCTITYNNIIISWIIITIIYKYLFYCLLILCIYIYIYIWKPGLYGIYKGEIYVMQFEPRKSTLCYNPINVLLF